MEEKPFFFHGPKHKLFGIYHIPAPPLRKTPFVFCHPLAEEKLWAHRVYVSLARALSAKGYPVLRFDFTGQGDSMGEFSRTDVEACLGDISSAIDTVCSMAKGATSVALFGLRFGASLAVVACQRNSPVSSLVLWQPVVDGAAYMQEVLRSNLSSQISVYGKVKINRKELVEQMRAGKIVEVEGYGLNQQFFEQAGGIQFDKKQENMSSNALILQLSPVQNPEPRPEMKAFASKFKSGHFQCVQEEPFWREIRRWYSSAPNAQKATITWVEANCG